MVYPMCQPITSPYNIITSLITLLTKVGLIITIQDILDIQSITNLPITVIIITTTVLLLH